MKPTDLQLGTELAAQLAASDLPAHAARHKTGGNDALVASDVGAAASDQGAVAAMNLGTLVLLTDTIAALASVQTQYNALLVKLRASGIIS